MMKKLIIYTSALLFLGLSSCTEYLDQSPLDQPSSETFLSSEIEVFLGVESCYEFLDPGNTARSRTYQRDMLNLEDAGMTRIDRNFNEFRDGNADPSMGNVSAYYSNYYRGIARCHLTIDGMEAAKEGMNIDLWNRLRAEARVIRAWSYYNLVNKFGDIPFTTSQLQMSDYVDLKRTPEDEVYEFILSEIEDAAQFLPATYSGEDVGRITSGAAYAVGAKAAVYRAYFHNGAAINPEAFYLDKVVEFTQKIIDSGAYELYYDQNDPKNSYKNLFVYTGENSKEVILQKEFNYALGKSTNINTAIGSRNYPNSFAGTVPQEALVASYEDTLGNTIDKSPYYDPKNPFVGREPRFYQTVVWPRVEGNQDIEVTLQLENGEGLVLKGYNEIFSGAEYPDTRDLNLTREFKSIIKPWGDEVGKDLDNWNWYTNENGISTIFNNQDATNGFSSFTGYLTWKYWNIDDYFAGTETQSSLNFMLIRYADILLMNAEARIDSQNDLIKATEYINMVRARGWGMSLGEYLSHPSAVSVDLGQDGLRAKVRRERKIELCFEGIRYEDLKRYGAAVKGLNGNIFGRPKFFHLEDPTNIPQIDEDGVVSFPWLDGLSGQDENYPRRWHSFATYREYYNLWPIPQTEFDNGNLSDSDQNPGYLGQ